MFYLRGRALRLVMLLPCALWMHSAWCHDSWEQILANVLTALAAVWGLRRIDAGAPAVSRKGQPGR